MLDLIEETSHFSKTLNILEISNDPQINSLPIFSVQKPQLNTDESLTELEDSSIKNQDSINVRYTTKNNSIILQSQIKNKIAFNKLFNELYVDNSKQSSLLEGEFNIKRDYAIQVDVNTTTCGVQTDNSDYKSIQLIN